MQHTAFFFFYSTLVYEVTQEYLHILAILNISLNNFALDVILCSFWFFKILCPCALIVLYRYFVSVLNLSVCSFETNCECMKSAYEQFWERSTLFSLADEFSYSTYKFLFTLKNNDQSIMIIFVFVLFVLTSIKGTINVLSFLLFEVIIHKNLNSYSPQISIIHNESQMWSVKSNSLLTTGLVAWPLVKKVLYYFAQSNNVLCR